MDSLYSFIINKTRSKRSSSNLFLARRFGVQPPSSGRIHSNIIKT